MKKLVSLFLLVLSASYGTQKVVAAPSWGTLASKYLLPRPVKGLRVLLLMRKADVEDRRKLNLAALLMEENLPIATVFKDMKKYDDLRSNELHMRNLVDHLRTASHTELNAIIAFLSVDARKVLPQASHLTHDELVEMIAETGEFRLRNSGDVSVEEMSETDTEEELKMEVAYYCRIISDVLYMSADGHADVINGFQALYAAEEFDKMHSILLDTWKKHYDALDSSDLANLLGGVAKEKKAVRVRIESLGMFSYPPSELLEVISKRDLEEVEEMAHKLDIDADKQAVVDYLARKRVPDSIFYLYDNTSTYGGIAHEGKISAKYHAVLDELNLAKDVLNGVHELDQKDMRYLARQLKKATK